MSRAIIHIGSHKTGTSFLQRHFHLNSAELLANGVYYPQLEDTPYVEQHSSLAIDLRATDKTPALNALGRIREFADKHQADVLLSGEAFFFATQDEAACLKWGLDASADCEFRILLYMRNTYDYIRSQLNQHLRFGDYLVTETEFLTRFALYKPDEIVQRWESVFGSEHVQVFSYDEQKLRLLDHFSEAVGIPRLRPCFVSREAMNRSIDFLCALMMNQLLFEKDSSLRAAVYSELISSHEVRNDFLYPAEAMMIESIIRQAGIEIRHPKLLQIEKYLTSIPDALPIPGQPKKSIERVIATLKVIDSIMSRI